MRHKIFFSIALKAILLLALYFSFGFLRNTIKTKEIISNTESTSISFSKTDKASDEVQFLKDSLTNTTMINDILFHDTTLSKHAYGNGFLVEHGQDTFAITAKHILTLVKTEQMKTVALGDEIKEWRMRPKASEREYVIVDKLLNASDQDSLSWQFMGKQGNAYADWLVFSIKKNNSNIVPLKLRNTPLSKAEKLYVNGWTFEDKESKLPRYRYQYHGDAGANFTMKILSARKNEFGLSGSPVVDENGLLVGIVSMTLRDSITNEVLNAPSKIRHLTKILNTIKNAK